MSSYLLINIIIIIIPLIFSFEKNLNFKAKFPAVIKVSLLLSIFFIIWDISSTESGVWIFNPEHILGFKIYNLPIEEVLFFFTVPYSMLFLFETINYYIPDKKVNPNKVLGFTVSAVFLVMAIIFYNYSYTFIVMSLTGLFILTGTLFPQALFSSRNYWLFTLISIVPFCIFDYLLTSIPVITYHPGSILGVRLLTIPVEDLVYNFILNSTLIFIYKRIDGK